MISDPIYLDGYKIGEVVLDIDNKVIRLVPEPYGAYASVGMQPIHGDLGNTTSDKPFWRCGVWDDDTDFLVTFYWENGAFRPVTSTIKGDWTAEVI